MRSKILIGALLLTMCLLYPWSSAMATIWKDCYNESNGYPNAGEGISCTSWITFDDWGLIGPGLGGNLDDGGRTAKQFEPINGFGPVIGQTTRVVTLRADLLTPEAPQDIKKDLTNTPVYTNAYMDSQVNFYYWGFTSPGFDRQADYTAYRAGDYSASTHQGHIFNNMLIDTDGDYLIDKNDFHFVYIDTFEYVDATGVNPPENVTTSLNFQPYPVSNAIGWCGSVLLPYPTGYGFFPGQLTFDFAMDVYNGPEGDRSFMGTQIIRGFEMRAYGSLNVHVWNGSELQSFSSEAVNISTYPGNQDRFDLDPNYYSNVSFAGAGVVPDGVWVSADSFKADGERNLTSDGTWSVTVVPKGTSGAVWYENSFKGYAFIFRAEALRMTDYVNPAVYPDTCPGKNCDDNNPCTTDTCFGGSCVHAAKGCNDNNICTTDTCNTAVGECVFIPVPGCYLCLGQPDGTACDDGNPCTYDYCDTASGNCAHKNYISPIPCNDGNACTTGDVCSNGVCTGTPKYCDDGNPCTVDSCDMATGDCAHAQIPDCPVTQLEGRLLIKEGSYFCMGAAYPKGSCAQLFGGADGGLLLDKYQPMHLIPAKCGNVTASGQGTGYSLPADGGGSQAIVEVFNFMGVPTYPSTNPKAWQTCNPHSAPTVTAGAVDPATGCRALSGDISAWDVFWNGSVFEQGPREGTPTNPIPIYAKGTLCPDDSYVLSWSALIVNGPFNGVTGYYLLVGHHNPCTTATCDDGNVCTNDSFNPVTCECINTPTPNTKPCDDLNPETVQDKCSNGDCVGIPAGCDDNNICTDDSSDPVTGACGHTFNTAPCEDGNPCTMNDTCSNGVCAGTPKCNLGNECIADSCEGTTGECIHTWISNPPICNLPDPLPVGTTLLIDQGLGSGPGTPCAAGSCFGMEVQPGLMIWTDYGGGTDGGIVLGKEQVSGGQETGRSATITTSGELSNAWLFFSNYGTFYTAPDGGARNLFDRASCSGTGCISKTELKVLNVAWNGSSIPMGSAAGCTLPPCSADQKRGVFVNDWQIDPVDGGLWSMNYSQVVPNGQFVNVKFSTIMRGMALIVDPCVDAATRCNDNNICTTDGYDPATCLCTHVNNTLTCNDNNRCTTNDRCAAGVCTGIAKNCADTNACTDDGCTPSTGICYHTNNTLPCNDNNVCTVNDACATGVCSGTLMNCSDNNDCTADSCDAGVCQHIEKNCNDNNACTIDSCNPETGKCINIPIVCTDNNACTTDSCDGQNGCQFTAKDCNDNNLCTIDSCVAGNCVNTQIDCNDNNTCTDDTCVSGVCQNPALPDNTSCTIDTSAGACSSAVCVPSSACRNKSVTLKGGRDGKYDTQIKTSFTVMNGGCILHASPSKVVVTPGTVLLLNCKQGMGPQPTAGSWLDVDLQVDNNHIIECPEATGDVGHLVLNNYKARGGRDKDDMVVRVEQR